MIFKELDSTDKVAGRVLSVHDGLFSGDHPGELNEYFIDELNTLLTPSFSTSETPYQSARDNMTENWTKLQKEDYYAEVYQEEVYVGGLKNQSAEQQFTVTYGNIHGLGSPLSAAFDSQSSQITKTIYSQHKNILLNPDDKKFTFTRKIDNSFIGYNSDSIYVINFSTARMKERVDEGNFMFTLGVEQTVKMGTLNIEETASYKVSFQDNSVFGTSVNYITSSPQFGRVFDLVKITDSDRYNDESADVVRMTSTPEDFVDATGQDIRYCPNEYLSFGLVYPDLGVIVFNPAAVSDQLKEGLDSAIEKYEAEHGVSALELDGETAYNKEENEGAKLAWYGDINPKGDDIDIDELIALKNAEERVADSKTWNTFSKLRRAGGDRNYQNFKKLIKALQLGEKFECRNTEIIPSKHYFIRIKNTDFNYSNNPSFVLQGYEADTEAKRANASRDDYLGRVRYDDFIIDPRVYITTIGLYNEDNELVAVAKLSKPILKTFDSEALIKVKLDF